jgi:xylulokinase
VPFKKTDVVRQMASVPGLRAGSYLIANNHETAGAALRWLRDRVLRGGDGLDDREITFDEITAAAATAPPGSGGVIFTPWLKGERSPVEDRNLRAAFLNVSLATERAHLLRAVLEGVALNARWLVDATEKFAGRSLDGLRIVGGGALSELWCQIHADVLGRPVHQVLDPMNVNVRGAAWFAAIGLGHLTIDDIAARRPPSHEFRPAAGAREVYEPLRREFVRLARDQKAMYRRLNGRGERR